MPTWLKSGAATAENIIGQLVPRSGQAIKGSYGQIINAGKQAASDTFMGSVGNSMLGGLRDAAGHIANGGNFKGALQAGFKDAQGNIMWNRAIGGGSMLAVGWRFATGGGIYRDKNGNFDVAGVPFI